MGVTEGRCPVKHPYCLGPLWRCYTDPEAERNEALSGEIPDFYRRLSEQNMFVAIARDPN